MDERNAFEIYFDDLNEECQARLFEFLGGENGNYDIFPLAVITKNEMED